MALRSSKKERIRRRRVYLVLSCLLTAFLLMLVMLEQRGAPPDAAAELAPPPAVEAVVTDPGPPAANETPVAERRNDPLPDPVPETATLPAKRVAIIIDDVGYHGELDALAAAIPFPLTFSVLPGLDSSAASAVRLRAAGCEVMLHLPMEPERYPEKNPGPGALFTFMTHDQLRRTIRADILSVPGARGVNNHMGSLFTVREDLLKVVFEELRRHGLYFVDSRTTTGTAAQRVAHRLGVRTASRSVFLDNSEEAEAITSQLEQLFQVASRERLAVGIGHYRESTLLVLASEVPKLCRRYPGVELVYASDVVN